MTGREAPATSPSDPGVERRVLTAAEWGSGVGRSLNDWERESKCREIGTLGRRRTP